MAIKLQWPFQVVKPEPAVNAEVIRQQAMAEVMRGLVNNTPAQSAQGAWPDSMMSSPVGAYHWDFPQLFTQPTSPRKQPGKSIDASTLRQMAEMYDPLRSCIEQLKREVKACPLSFQSREAKKTISDAALAEINAWFGAGGGCGGPTVLRTQFEDEILEDLLVIGVSAIYHQKRKNGKPYADIPIDAATIRPWVSAYGWTDPSRMFEQYVQGMMVATFGLEELTYRGLHSKTHTPYFTSPIEWLLSAVMSGIKADEWNLSWLVTGNTASDMMALPESWTVDQIKAWMVVWDAMNAGDPQQRNGKLRMVPGGSQRVNTGTRKDQDFENFQLWLVRRTCSIMGVQPASIGYAGEQYKVSQEGSMEQTSAFGVGELLVFRKAFYDESLARLGFPDVEAVNVTSKDEKAADRTKRLVVAAGGPIVTINEARKEAGLDPIEGGDVIRDAPGQDVEQPEPGKKQAPGQKGKEDAKRAAFMRWERKALSRLRDRRGAACSFVDPAITADESDAIISRLQGCETAEAVRTVFRTSLVSGRVADRLARVSADD